MAELRKYSHFVGKKKIEEIYRQAEKLKDKHILNINSTYQGGGVAEILNRFVPLMNELGIDYGWRILHGSPDFFITTKKLSNAMQGEKIRLTQQKKKLCACQSSCQSQLPPNRLHNHPVWTSGAPLFLVLYRKLLWLHKCFYHRIRF